MKVKKRKIVVASNGTMAEGLVSTLELFMGKQERITYLNFYTDVIDYDRAISRLFSELEDDEELIICTDIFYGKVFQVFLPYLPRHNVHMVTGVNLPLLLEIATHQGDASEDFLEKCIVSAREQLHFVDTGRLKEEKLPESFF